MRKRKPDLMKHKIMKEALDFPNEVPCVWGWQPTGAHRQVRSHTLVVTELRFKGFVAI